MEILISTGIAAGIGLLVGYGVARLSRRDAASGKQSAPLAPVVNWWELRKSLTGIQLQILIFLEARKYATIGDVQTKFEFIPDRELYYRLEQIVLLAFVCRGREHGNVVYILNPAYATTVEDDKTVMLSS
jgi:hypothetical protein